MSSEELKQKLESLANTIRTVLLVEQSMSPMSKTVLREQVEEIDALSAEWAYEGEDS